MADQGSQGNPQVLVEEVEDDVGMEFQYEENNEENVNDDVNMEDNANPNGEEENLEDELEPPTETRIMKQVKKMLRTAMAESRMETTRGFQEMRDEIKGLVAALRPVTEESEHGAGPTGPKIIAGGATGSASGRRHDRVSFKSFKSCGAHEFGGDCEALVAMEWLDHTERIFRLSHIWDSDRVEYAAGMLIGSASTWWKNVSGNLGEDIVKALTWPMFVKRFQEQFCPKDAVKASAREFMFISQGALSVMQYEAQFGRNLNLLPDISRTRSKRFTTLSKA